MTTIDIAGELFGLSTLFLGVEFYSPNLRRPEFDTFFLWGTLSQFAVLMDSHNVTKGITPTTSASRMVSLQFPSLSR